LVYFPSFWYVVPRKIWQPWRGWLRNNGWRLRRMSTKRVEGVFPIYCFFRKQKTTSTYWWTLLNSAARQLLDAATFISGPRVFYSSALPRQSTRFGATFHTQSMSNILNVKMPKYKLPI
jgi:hypothetical protein